MYCLCSYCVSWSGVLNILRRWAIPFVFNSCSLSFKWQQFIENGILLSCYCKQVHTLFTDILQKIFLRLFAQTFIISSNNFFFMQDDWWSKYKGITCSLLLEVKFAASVHVWPYIFGVVSSDTEFCMSEYIFCDLCHILWFCSGS